MIHEPIKIIRLHVTERLNEHYEPITMNDWGDGLAIALFIIVMFIAAGFQYGGAVV
jgi:hypothetical protein